MGGGVFQGHGDEGTEHDQSSAVQFGTKLERVGGHGAPVAQFGAGVAGFGEFVQHAMEGNLFALGFFEFEGSPGTGSVTYQEFGHSSEFAAPVAGPAFYDYFGLGVKFDAVVGLGVEVAEEAFAPAAEGERRHRSGDADVDADVAGIDFIAEAAGVGAVGGEDARHVSVAAVIDQGDRFVDGFGVHQAEHGAEDFGAGGFGVGRNLVEDRREDEEAFFEAVDFRGAAVYQDARAFLFSVCDEPL